MSGRRCFSARQNFIHECVGCFLQNNSPRAEDCECDNKNKQEGQNRQRPDAKAEPDHVRLVDEIETIGINSDETEDLGENGGTRNKSGDADNYEKATRASGEIDKNITVVVKPDRGRIQNKAG